MDPMIEKVNVGPKARIAPNTWRKRKKGKSDDRATACLHGVGRIGTDTIAG
jgi:hypothetical protein